MYMGEATYSGWHGEAGPTGAWLNPALLPGTMTIQGNERLPVACIFNSSLPSSLVDQVDILTPELVLRGFIVCLYTQIAHGYFRGKDSLDPIHHEEMHLSRGSTG
jgi:hypothetical protein